MQSIAHRIDQHAPQLKSPAFRRWLDEPVFALKNGSVSITRRELSILTESPCTRAAKNLHYACMQVGVHSIVDLSRIGLDGLLRIPGIGERAAWVAALILDQQGVDVDAWMRRRTRRGSWAGQITLVHSKTKRQKHG